MSKTSRWCPTPEQLMVLEELYRGGLRTPKAPLIQKITAHLSSYGKIEGKNVFYWFQNHKARDRQKLRRKLMSMQLLQQQQQQPPLQTFFPLFPSPTFHQLPSHAAMIHQGMAEDVLSARTSRDNILKLSLTQNNEVPSSVIFPKTIMTSTLYNNNNMVIPTNILSSCNNDNTAPFKTLDLFPTTSGNLRYQN